MATGSEYDVDQAFASAMLKGEFSVSRIDLRHGCG